MSNLDDKPAKPAYPLPWNNNADTIWRGSKPVVILPINDPASIQDAQYIVQACNAFPALYAALEGVLCDDTIITIGSRLIMDGEETWDEQDRRFIGVLEAARNALAMARGERGGA